MKSKIEKYLKYVAAAVFVATLAINVVITLDDPFVLLSDEAIATGSNGDKVREVIVGAGLYITKITGQAALDAGFSVGMRLGGGTAGLSTKIQGQITTSLKDEFTILCYEGGNTYCTPIDWHVCASTGCPEAGITGTISSASSTDH